MSIQQLTPLGSLLDPQLEKRGRDWPWSPGWAHRQEWGLAQQEMQLKGGPLPAALRGKCEESFFPEPSFPPSVLLPADFLLSLPSFWK